MRMLLVVLAGVVGAFLFASSALATTSSIAEANASVSLYRPFPNGIDSSNPQHALAEIQSRAAWDSSYAQTIAQQAGRSVYVPSEYRAMGYAPHASVGSTNSGVTGNGAVVPVADHGGSQYVKVFEMINIVSQKTVELMVRCGNPRLKPSVSVVVIPWKPFSKGTVIRFNRKVSKPVSITCPSGQKVSGTLTTTVSGFTRASTWGKVQGSLKLKLREKISLQVKSWVSLHCGPAPKPPAPKPAPPAPPAPPATFSATATATATASATCPDGTSASASGSGYGSATSTVSQADADQKAHSQAQATANANAQASVKCGSAPPPSKCVTITSATLLNDINEGRNSGPAYYAVNACAAGSMTIDPGNGGVSDCNSSVPQYTPYVVPLTTGNNTICVVIYAPLDLTANTTTVKATAIVGTDQDVNTQTFKITHPVRSG